MSKIAKLFDKAEKLLQKERWDAARDALREILNYQPEDETVLLKLGEVSAKLQQNAEALHYWGRLLDLNIGRGETSKALAAGRRILRVAPRETATLAKLAPLYEKAEKVAEAAGTYREMLRNYRAVGDTTHACACLREIVRLAPDDLDAWADLGELQARQGDGVEAARALLRASGIARAQDCKERWADYATRAHQLDPANGAARFAAAEVSLAQNRSAEAAALLEPLAQSQPADFAVLENLVQAYLRLNDYAKAGPLCLKLDQSRPETLGRIEQAAHGLLANGDTPQALRLIDALRNQLTAQQKKQELLSILERLYPADEANLKILEMLAGLYNELNRDEGVRWSLGRLFHLYLAGEQYDQAAETLEKILDVEPYGAGHQDRLLNLEGHIDPAWYRNLEGRLRVPGAAPEARPVPREEAARPEENSEGLDTLILEAELYQNYELREKLQNTLHKIQRLYPNAEERSERLRRLYDAADIQRAPSPVLIPTADAPVAGPPGSREELSHISRITGNIHRAGTLAKTMYVAVDEIRRALAADRCWGALGPGVSPEVAAESQAPGTLPSPAEAAAKVYAFLMDMPGDAAAGWAYDDVDAAPALQPVAAELRNLGIASLLGLPLVDKAERLGFLLVESCRACRAWTRKEMTLLEALGTQIVIAVNNARLRRLVRSIAGSDAATGLLPRTSYIDCLLAEARQAKEHARPLSVCLLEPVGGPDGPQSAAEPKFQSYFQQVSTMISSHLRQNDLPIRYRPYTVAVCLPETTAAQARQAVERLCAIAGNVPLETGKSPGFCAAICELQLGAGFNAVDSVTEAINRLENSMERVRAEAKAQVLISCCEE